MSTDKILDDLWDKAYETGFEAGKNAGFAEGHKAACEECSARISNLLEIVASGLKSLQISILD